MRVDAAELRMPLSGRRNVVLALTISVVLHAFAYFATPFFVLAWHEPSATRFDAMLVPLAAWLQQHGQVDDQEMARTFNCGIGMVVVVAKEHADRASGFLRDAGETVFTIGEIRARQPGEKQAIVSR